MYPGEADSIGKFAIANLVPGDYIVLALPWGAYVPTYYSQTGSATSWERATKISINGNSVTGITIVAKPLVKSEAGYSSIVGVVSVSGGPGDGLQSATPAGAIVYAFLNTEDVAGFGVTDETGKFTIEELAPGSYTLVADKVNFISGASAKANAIFDATVGAASSTPAAFLMMSPVTVTAVGEQGSLPSDFVLEQNYPNPFNPSTTISYQLPKESSVSISVFNMLGQVVATLVNEKKEAGYYRTTWNANVPSGVYFYRLLAGEYVEAKKMVLLR